MPQIQTKPQPAKPVIDATVPVENPTSPIKNISDKDLKHLHDGWDQKAEVRKEAVARETALPTEPSVVMRFELRKYGRHWNGYLIEGKKSTPLLVAPSLLVSALDAIDDAIRERAWREERSSQ